jgi:hypothetical protein
MGTALGRTNALIQAVLDIRKAHLNLIVPARLRINDRRRAELSLLTTEEITRGHFENAAELRRVREERERLGDFRARKPPQSAEQRELLPPKSCLGSTDHPKTKKGGSVSCLGAIDPAAGHRAFFSIPRKYERCNDFPTSFSKYVKFWRRNWALRDSSFLTKGAK